jgi:hypothetical protein
MHNEKPTPPGPNFTTPPSGNPTVANTGRYIDGNKINDSSDWLEIATLGDYSLILRKDPLPNTCYYDEYPSKVKTWYSSTLPAISPLRPFISRNNAGWKNGDINSLTNGLSKPTGVLAGTSDNDTCFLLSYGEFAQFCSKQTMTDSLHASVAAAKANANRITTEAQWSSTYVPSSMSGYGYMLNGTVDAKLNTASTVHPAMWILTSAFDTLAK